MSILHPNAESMASSVAGWIDGLESSAEATDQLLDLLIEGRFSASEIRPRELARLRSYALASLERLGMIEPALAIALEQLTFGIDAYSIAAAAKSLRGAKPSREFVPALLAALRNVSHTDDFISFDEFRPNYPIANPTTATSEILRTLRWLKAVAADYRAEILRLAESTDSALDLNYRAELRNLALELPPPKSEASSASCCSAPLERRQASKSLRPNEILAEDQHGNAVDLAMLIKSHEFTILTFFYTRCENVRKCSTTISKFAALQKHVRPTSTHQQMQLLAITYDPDFDLPQRLSSYGEARGFEFDSQSRFLRVTYGFEKLRSTLALLVDYSGGTVSGHAVELLVLNSKSELIGDFSRQTWSPEQMIDLITKPSENRLILSRSGISGVMMSVFIAILPKCPFCISTYLSAIGVTTFSAFETWRSITVLAVVAFMIYAVVILRQCWKSQFWWPAVFGLTGTAVLTSSLFSIDIADYRLIGLACVILASGLGHWSMSRSTHLRLFR